MVKGTSRQVIVVKSPDPKLFEQAIFILREDAQGVSDQQLLQEAKQAVRQRNPIYRISGPWWALGGAGCTAFLWLLSRLFG